MKVTFDSNTWRKIASPNRFPKDPAIIEYRLIREAINDGKVIPFISETVFTLEAIKRNLRKDFFKTYKAIRTSKISPGPEGSMKMEFSIGPNPDAHPGNNEFLKEHFKDAVELGFNVLSIPRIGGVINKDIEAYKYKMESDEFQEYLSKLSEVIGRIHNLNAGDYEVFRLANKYNPAKGINGLGDAPDSEDGVIAAAVAEWADGDSVAAHIAVGGDFFCTNDQAKSAGAKSVFSTINQALLKNEYNLIIISPEDLAKIL